MPLTIEYQIVQEACRDCGVLCDVVRGPVYEDGSGIGLYLALLHGCSRGDTVVFTVALDQPSGPQSWTFQAWPGDDAIGMQFIDGNASPWAEQGYLGRLLSEDEARSSVFRERVFEIADLVCESIPAVSQFLDRPRG